jgi:D-alanine-D-alanine ligase
MKKLRVMMVVHYTLVPPDDLHDKNDPRMEKFRTEFDVKQALLALSHEVQVVGVYDDLAPVRKVIEEWKPHIAFNLLEDFAGNSAFDYYVVSYFKMMRIPHTGCNPRGLLLARDKALTKMILTYHRISVPDFDVFPLRKKISKRRKFTWPLIVKSLTEEGSVGIAKASYVENEAQLRERVALIHEKLNGDAIAEQFIEGRELYVSVLGNTQVRVLPIWELTFENLAPGMYAIATANVKHNIEYQKKRGIFQQPADLDPSLIDEIKRASRRVYRYLELDGYARIDYRLTPSGEIYFLEANPNPDMAQSEEFASSAEADGLKYKGLVQRIVDLGLARAGR